MLASNVRQCIWVSTHTNAATKWESNLIDGAALALPAPNEIHARKRIDVIWRRALFSVQISDSRRLISIILLCLLRIYCQTNMDLVFRHHAWLMKCGFCRASCVDIQNGIIVWTALNIIISIHHAIAIVVVVEYVYPTNLHTHTHTHHMWLYANHTELHVIALDCLATAVCLLLTAQQIHNSISCWLIVCLGPQDPHAAHV